MAENNIGKLFVTVPSGMYETFVTKHIGDSITSTDAYYNKVVFLEGKGEIATHGKIFGANTSSDLAAINAILAGFGTGEDETATVAGAISALRTELLGSVEEGDSKTIAAVNARIKAIETLIGADGDTDATINKLQEVLNWFSGVSETETGASLIQDVAAAKSAIGNAKVVYASESEALAAGKSVGDVKTAATGLYKKIEDAAAANTAAITTAIEGLDSSVTAKDASEYVTVTIAEADGKLTETGSSVAVKTATSSSLVSDDTAGVAKVINPEGESANVGVSYNKLKVADASTAEGLATVADLSAKYKADMDKLVAALNAQAEKIAYLEYAHMWETYAEHL